MSNPAPKTGSSGDRSSSPGRTSPPDHQQRQQALDPTRSILVQAPAGSGKTTLLTERFLSLLAEIDDPGQVVAITFTNAAATEMRNRILDELRADHPTPLARRALDRSSALNWNLVDLPAQLRISTIDGFCRDLALQQPLLSGLGGGLAIAEQPTELYRRAVRQTLQKIDGPNPALSTAIQALLLWRDNNWQELETLLVAMLGQRDRWMHGFLLDQDPDWESLRQRLELPFATAVRNSLINLSQLLDQVPGAREEALELARFACEQSGGQLHRDLAELAEFPTIPLTSIEELEEARQAHLCLSQLLLTTGAAFRKQVDKRLGFPADRKGEKARILNLIADLAAIPGLESALATLPSLPSLHYTEEEWLIVRACFTLLRHAAAELQVVFAETASVDFTEVAQIALRVLRGPDGLPSDAALAIADGIRHLLVDEFQDTSRRQHQLLAHLIAAWPDRTNRTCFAVGDPMQSIYFFRDADAELFPRVRNLGLELPNADPAHPDPLLFHFVPLTSNFRTAPSLVRRINEIFVEVFAVNDSSGAPFSPSEPARSIPASPLPPFTLHLDFVPQARPSQLAASGSTTEKEAAHAAQTQQIAALIQSHVPRIQQARASGEKYRVAVLGRTRSALAPVARALREAAIPFRALDLEKLAARPEILDALALARALLNPHDRVSWLGVLRAPWCGLTLRDLHLLTSADDPALFARPVPELLAERLPLLSEEGQHAAARVLEAFNSTFSADPVNPSTGPGTRLQQLWLRLGGADCCDATAHANLDLLWSCLDHLPAGEQDLLGPALDAALDKLTALPDPSAESDCGVQLMTIHKSKGLEFEVVIVPDLQASSGRGNRKLLSWLERGLAEPDLSGQITEFLIAPLQTKGADRGNAKAWVDRVYRDREIQEDRRILYVAATRAREELHLFARPAYKIEADGSLTLPDPSNSLLATAWPALADEVRARFENWKAARAEAITGDAQVIESIAASAQSNLLVMPSGAQSPVIPTLLSRLPPDYSSGAPGLASETWGRNLYSSGPSALSFETWERNLYTRHEGGLLSRALGTAVHSLFEELARLRANNDWSAARFALQRFEPRIAAQVRALGVDQPQAANLASQALQLALGASHDPIAQWILSPHPDALSEVRWAGIVNGALTTVRVDRVFRAGLAPNTDGQQAWWIVDYKTAHADTSSQDPSASLPALRTLFAPQLEAYAKILRNLHGADAVLRAALYYPRMLLLDWWEL